MSSIDEIKARIDIVDLVSETVQLRHSGKNYLGFCPFHTNTRTPAFVVFPETGTWRCFGQCNEGGDIFGFVMKKEGWDFGETLTFLAEKAGVELKVPTPEERAAVEENENLRSILEDAVTYFRHNLLHTQPGTQVIDYLHQKRGLNNEIIEVFGLGYALDSWEAGLTYFQSKGFAPSDLLECGLVTEREATAGENAPGVYDRFRNRIMFPIRDERGRMTGFGARIVNPEDIPKFINSPQTILFDKGHILYGLDQARKGIRSKDQAVVVEGYLDVIALHQAGFTNVVSPMGTALTETQLRLLKKFSRRIVLALDADAAGDKATLRGLQIARQTLDREADPIFDARGLIGTEARLQADIRVTTLPAGLDPDEVVSQDPVLWEQLIGSAKPIVIHVMDTLAKEKDINDPKVKSEVAKQILPLIRDVPDRVERDAYLQRLARLLQVDESVLLDNLGLRTGRPPTSRGSRSRRPRQNPPQEEADKSLLRPMSEALENHLISVLIRQPELIHRLDRELKERSLYRISESDFQISQNQTIYKIIASSLNQDYAEPATYVLNCLDQSLMEVADTLLLKSQKLDFSQERIFEDMIRSLLLLRRQSMNLQIEHTRFVMEEAQQSGDTRAIEYQREISQLTESRLRLDVALGHFTNHFIK